MKHIYLAQMLCPNRHAITGLAFHVDEEDAAHAAAEIEAHKALLQLTVEGAIGEKVINPWCALCRAKFDTWHVETARTNYTTMEEALPELRRVEEANLRSREAILSMQKKASEN